MKNSNRKVDEVARQEISNILLFEISDERLRFVTITSCKVSFDRGYADVYYTTDPGSYGEVESAFEKAKGYIRTLMAKRLDWKKAPELRFRLDDTIDTSQQIESMLAAERERIGEDPASDKEQD